MKVWIVFYGNYFPRELDSVWETEELAEAHTEYLNNIEKDGCGYEWEWWKVRGENDRQA